MMADTLTKKKSHWTVVIVVIIAVIGLFFVWWYVNQMGFNPLPSTGVRTLSEEARINQDLESIDVGDLDTEFESIDSDLNSL